jgi:hypothetical protein
MTTRRSPPPWTVGFAQHATTMYFPRFVGDARSRQPHELGERGRVEPHPGAVMSIVPAECFLWIRCPACRTINAIDLRALDRHHDANSRR